MDMWVWYVLAGMAAGILSSMFGVGAGIILVPLLGIAFGFAQKSAQGMALAVMVPMALAGAIRYYYNPDVPINLPTVAWVAVGAVVGALLGSKIAFSLSGLVLKRLFACFIIIVGVNMLVKSFRGSVVSDQPGVERNDE